MESINAFPLKYPIRSMLLALIAVVLMLCAPPVYTVAATGLFAAFLCFLRQPPGYDPEAPEKLLFFAAGFYFLAWLFVGAVHGQLSAYRYAGYVALLVVYPLHRVCRRGPFDERVLWRVLAAVSGIAVIMAAVSLVLQNSTAAFTTSQWGDVAFVLGAMTLAGAGQSSRRLTRLGLLAVAVLGMMAGLIFGGWAVWLALPVVIAVWFFLPPTARSSHRWTALLAVAIDVDILLFVPLTDVATHFRWLALQTGVWWHHGSTAGVFGIVLNDWSSALARFAAYPWVGVSVTNAAGGLNQYILTLHDSGLLGALALAFLLVIPMRFFVCSAGHHDPAVQRVGCAGVLLVTAYGVMGLLVPLLSLDRTLVFYVFMVTMLYAVIRNLRVASWARPVARHQSLSVTIITKNEADRIGRCLESVVGWPDEIIVLDSGSTDDTVAIARRYTDQVEETDWPGFGIQKQRALERAHCGWVLSLDADEEMTPALKQEIDATLTENPACVVYGVPWAVMAYGKRLDFGRHARAPLRLVQRDGAHFTPDIVHEKIAPPPGNIGQLESRLLHYTIRDYGHALDKTAHYAWLGARLRHERGRRGGGLVMAAVRSGWFFVYVYFLRFGFLDGGPGFLDAVLNAQYTFNKYAGLWDLRRSAQRDKPHS